MEHTSVASFVKETQNALEQLDQKPGSRDALRYLDRCLEGLRLVPEGDSESLVNWHDGRTTPLRKFSPDESEAVATARRLMKLKQAVHHDLLQDENKDFEDEYSGKGKYRRSVLSKTQHILNPVDGTAFSVTGILPRAFRSE